jgi:hypothetical protein
MKNFTFYTIILISLVVTISSNNSNAQLNQVVTEVYYDPQFGPPVSGYPENHITYRIYAELQNPNDFVSAIFADPGCHSLSISADNQIFNHPFGATVGDALNIAFCGFVPTLCYDSYVTIEETVEHRREQPLEYLQVVQPQMPGLFHLEPTIQRRIYMFATALFMQIQMILMVFQRVY